MAKCWGIKDHESKSEDYLIKILSEPKTKISFSKKKIKYIKKDFNESRYEFPKSKIKELEESVSRLKKYYDYDNIEYKGMRCRKIIESVNWGRL